MNFHASKLHEFTILTTDVMRWIAKTSRHKGKSSQRLEYGFYALLCVSVVKNKHKPCSWVK